MNSERREKKDQIKSVREKKGEKERKQELFLSRLLVRACNVFSARNAARIFAFQHLNLHSFELQKVRSPRDIKKRDN